MSVLSDIVLRIRSTFEKKPVEEATVAIDDLGKKSKDAGTSGAEGMDMMGTATAAMSGNLTGVATGVAQLASKVKLLGASMMQLSLVAAVLTMLVKLFQAISDRAEKMAEGLRSIKSGNVEAAIGRISKSYDDMREASDRANTSRDKLFDVNAQELEAIKNLELAQIELNKQKELGAAKTDEERAAIESKYKALAMEKSKTFDAGAADRQRELLQAKAATSNKEADAAEQAAAEITEQVRRRQQQTSYAAGMASKKASKKGSWGDALTLGSLSRGQEGYQAEAETGRAAVGKGLADIDKLQKTAADLREAAAIYTKQAETVVVNKQATDTGYQAASTAAATDDRMRSERDANRRERERIQQEIEAKSAAAARYQESTEGAVGSAKNRADNEQREYGAARDVAMKARGTKGYDKVLAAAKKERDEANAALDALRQLSAERAAMLKRMNAEIQALRDTQKRLPN